MYMIIPFLLSIYNDTYIFLCARVYLVYIFVVCEIVILVGLYRMYEVFLRLLDANSFCNLYL